MYSLWFKNKIKNIESQIGEILRTPSLGRNLLALIKKVYAGLNQNPFAMMYVGPKHEICYEVFDLRSIRLCGPWVGDLYNN